MSGTVYDALTADGINAAVTADRAISVTVSDEVGSTNTVLRSLAEDGAPEGTVVCASSQTAGRGRMGRSFFSPDGSGIYLSILLRPELSCNDAAMITPAAAVAVCRAIRRVCGIEAQIKWVNDVFAGEKKVCGILTESSVSGKNVAYAVVGIGVNVYEPHGGFPDAVRDIAGAVTDVRETGLRDRLCAAIIDEVFALYDGLADRSFLGEYRERCFIIGRRVGVVPVAMAGSDGIAGEATVIGIDGDCRLMLRFDDGRTVAMSSGEVRVKPIR